VSAVPLLGRAITAFLALPVLVGLVIPLWLLSNDLTATPLSRHPDCLA
jgi:hypothetical protein